MNLNEDSLKAGDLKLLVNHIFEIDSFRSKMGDDEDIVVLSFTVDDYEPALDMVNFIEKGYQCVLDADATPGELSNGKYKVFVELDRDRNVAKNIIDLIYGIQKLTGIDEFKFRYYKSFDSIPLTIEALEEHVPSSAKDYKKMIQEREMNNYDNFFSKSMSENITIHDNNIIEFKKSFMQPIYMKYVKFGTSNDIFNETKEHINILYESVAEILFLTKYIGNYNITKFGDNKFIFENKNYSVVMERL